MDHVKSIFLTGCASGIGRHLANRLVREGHRVFATDINAKALESAAEDSHWPVERTDMYKLDVTDPGAWDRVFRKAVKTFDSIDVLLNVAGILRAAWAQDTSREDIDAQLDVNVKGCIYGTQTAARYMVERHQGHIINFASLAGLAPIPGLSVYCASKFAVRGFSLTAAAELRPYGVSVTVVCPDSVDTPLLNLPPENDAASMLFSGKRLLTVEQVGDLIVNRVLPLKPVQASIPLPRALLARLGDLCPPLAMRLLPRLQRRGRANRRTRIRGG